MTTSSNRFIISGKILFENNSKPNQFPAGTILTVKLQDTNMACAAAIEIAEVKYDVNETFAPTEDLTYTIEAFDLEKNWDYSLQALINVGWTPSGDDWIRKGDFINDWHHSTVFESANASLDVTVKKYDN